MVAVLAVDGFDEAITVANGVDYGLSASLVTRDYRKALTYADRIECGVVKVNQISTGLALQAPFGGVKQQHRQLPRAGHGWVGFLQPHQDHVPRLLGVAPRANRHFGVCPLVVPTSVGSAAQRRPLLQGSRLFAWPRFC